MWLTIKMTGPSWVWNLARYVKEKIAREADNLLDNQS